MKDYIKGYEFKTLAALFSVKLAGAQDYQLSCSFYRAFCHS